VSGQADDGFFSRWSRRKAQVREGGDVPAGPSPAGLSREPPPAVPPALPAVPTALPGHAVPGSAAAAGGAAWPSTATADAGMPPRPGASAAEAAPPPPPTMDDVAQLTPAADFSRFVAPGVDAQVKNAAMKKLFADPHFNVMDGLDTYIDDYHNVEPLPKSMLRQMVQARVLGLLDDELQDQHAQAAPGPAADSLAPPPDEDPSSGSPASAAGPAAEAAPAEAPWAADDTAAGSA
jgi:hypothetical protein